MKSRVEGGGRLGGGVDRREEAAESGFDLPFEGRKREKVVINSLLFIPPARSPASTSSHFPLLFFHNREEESRKSHSPAVTRNEICSRGKASDSARTNARARAVPS